MKVFRIILIVVALIFTAFNADQKDIVGAIMWAGIFFLNLIMFAIEVITDNINKK
jgi:hypothetical protein